MKKLIGISTSLASTIALLPARVAAESYSSTSDSGAAVAAAGFGVFFLILLLIIGGLILVSFVFWLIMLIHAAQNDIPDKNMWIVILIVSFFVGLPLIGALVYYFVVKKSFAASSKPAPAKKAKK